MSDPLPIAGRIKDRPEDFEVEEIPAYEPSGTGDHLFLWIEKVGTGAEYFVRQLARRLGVAPADIGTAGLKDRHAVTRQWVSVPASAEPQLSQVETEGVRLLRHSRHTNKLKPGHLHGNRFRILIRDADSTGKPHADATIERLQRDGLANFYGPQRFGRDHETANLGMALLRGDSRKRLAPFLRKLALSAAQSVLFNACLERRIANGNFRTVLAGDVMCHWPSGGMFRADDVPAEQARFDNRQTVHAGPMFGRKMFPAGPEVAEREAEVLRQAELTPASFDGFGKLLNGTRRHNVVYPGELTATWEPDGLRLTFTLPAGSYATVLLREVMGVAVDADEVGE